MLWKKMIRDILLNKGSYMACLLLAMMSLMIYTSFSILNENMYMSQEIFYRQQNFAEGFAEVSSLPEGALGRLQDTPGIRQLDGRLVRDVQVYIPGGEENVYLRLVSRDPEQDQPLNEILVRQGSIPDPGSPQVFLESQFYDANGYAPGDTVRIIAGGRVRELTVAGSAMSPEFTYPLRDDKEMYPNPLQFGIAFVPEREMEKLFPGDAGTVNSLLFTLEDGADFEVVRRHLEDRLKPYGLLAVYPRADQFSHLILDMEISNLGNMAKAMPVMFLFIAGIILYIMLKRLVEQQRTQIGIMKALGYSESEVLWHFLSYGLFIGAAGGLAGGLLGLWLANPLTTLMLSFFVLPMVYAGFSWMHLLTGMVLSLLIFGFAGYHGCKQALQMKPADAMRPPAPSFTRKTRLERLNWLWNRLSTQAMMATRNLFRAGSRSFFLFLGITLSCAVVAMTWSFSDMSDKLLFYQYDEVEVYDAKLTLSGPMDRSLVARELARRPEIGNLEPHLEVPARLFSGWRYEDSLLLGIPGEGSLYRVLDDRGRLVSLGREGIVLSGRLAEKLGVGPGESLELETPFRADGRRVTGLTVQAVIPQYVGVSAFMDLETLEILLGRGPVATSFLLDMGERDVDESVASLRQTYRESPFVAGVDGSEERLRQTREMMESFGMAIYIYVLVGVMMCFAIIYSSSFIILSERSRELASMMVLGMSPKEVFAVITWEQWFISVFAILAGVPLGQLMQAGFAGYISTDLFVIPAALSRDALLVAPLITMLSIWTAQRFVLRKIHQINIIDVLKSRE